MTSPPPKGNASPPFPRKRESSAPPGATTRQPPEGGANPPFPRKRESSPLSRRGGKEGEQGHKRTAFRLLALVPAMFAFGFLLVPLYDLLCEVTGFNGKTAGQYTAALAEQQPQQRLVTVQFLASNNGAMPWEFRPAVRSMQVHPGQMYATDFHARNITGQAMTAQAVPSVTPFRAAAYLHKTECFCFEQQRLAAGESLDMPLRFIVDAGLPEDVQRLTLSYTLFNAH